MEHENNVCLNLHNFKTAEYVNKLYFSCPKKEEMRVNFYTLVFIGLIMFLPTTFGYGQLSVDQSAIITLTDYPSGVMNDTIFCFQPTSPMVVRFDGGTNFSMTWFKYDVNDNSWDNIIQNGGEQLQVTEEGGYRVVVQEDGSMVADRRFWVFNSQSITDVKAEIVNDDCYGVDLYATSTIKPLFYFDPANGSYVPLMYDLSYTWTTDPEGDEQYTGQEVSFNAPFNDVSFVVNVSDQFGNSVNDSIEYEAIAVKADFEVKSLKDTVLNERNDEVNLSAPYEIQFVDNSQGKISAWEWTFGEAGRSIDQNPRFVFAEAGTYEVSLYVLNRDSGCESISDVFQINISESELEVPNVFTPNGDGINDEFRVAYKSLKKFEMVVFNRWGRKVYQSKDPAKGWDGDGHAPGVYFYYIYAEGYNEGEVYKKEGAVHLIRGK
ncbi:gliding motility-associated C-terminal domain-containing protein [Thermophagus xiamenensis]|uniref:Gliding motility-associated C-terminal domain-containing protein n=2 Tax=Thermophagus xiamenensis TaxID=385682 RepID=A0A1I1UEF9_9BACT|nr:gliding motility-associated C-terminal domain-containing protein [Thermophagus xiamenensis]